MADYTRPATWDDLRELAAYLESAGVEYALVGGYATAVHGIHRYSEDIDILVEPGAENARRWMLALGRLPDAAVNELADEPDVFARDRRYAIRVNDEFTVDVMPSIEGSDGCRGAGARHRGTEEIRWLSGGRAGPATAYHQPPPSRPARRESHVPPTATHRGR